MTAVAMSLFLIEGILLYRKLNPNHTSKALCFTKILDIAKFRVLLHDIFCCECTVSAAPVISAIRLPIKKWREQAGFHRLRLLAAMAKGMLIPTAATPQLPDR